MNPLPRDVGGPGAGADSDERKANDELLQQLLQQSRASSQQGHVLPLLEASFQQQSQLNQQLQLLQNSPLVNLQNSLRLAATLNPNLGLLQNQLAAPIPSSLESLVAQQGAYLQQFALPGVSNAATLAGLNQFTAQPAARHPPPEGLDLGALKDSKDEKGKRDPVHAFPSRLHEILAMPEYSEYIAWLPHGRAWKVLNRRMFEKKVIPQHFRHARYASFMRQVSYHVIQFLANGGRLLRPIHSGLTYALSGQRVGLQAHDRRP